MEFNFPLSLVSSLNTITSPTKHVCVLELYEALAANEPKLYDTVVYEPEYVRKARQLKEELLNAAPLIHKILSEVQPYKVTTYEIERSIATLDEISKNAQYFTKKVNQISVFMPSNLPLYSLLLFGIIPSFMVKQKLIIKPNQLMREKMIFEQLYDALNVSELFSNIETVNSETQKFIDQYVPDSDIVVFTGYNKNRDKILSLIKPGSLLIYNGSGHNPIVVGKNADIEKAAKDACYAKFFNSGQDCAGPDAILVQQEIFEEFMQKYLEEVNALKVGGYDDEEVDVGPITRKGELQKFLGFLFDADAEKIKCGGKIDMNRKIVYPTVICDKLSEESNLEEVFGPISFVYSYANDQDVSIYFNDKNGTYQRNKMYVSLYGSNEYVEQRDDIKHPKNAGIGIVLYDKNVHHHEEGDKAYGGYSLGASGVFFKTDETNYQSKALPIYVPEVVALHSERKLFTPRINAKEAKKAKKNKNANIVEPFKVTVKECFGDNLIFAFMFDNASNILICVKESNVCQERTFENEVATKLQIEDISNLNISIIVLSELESMADNFNLTSSFNESVAYAMAGSKSAAIGDMPLLSNLTSKINKAVKNHQTNSQIQAGF
uniref:Aldehyde dehydrogenase domain-containing protein n=1 Tax=Panagrolaimus superbus TaxID=310955 RepID=A0A914YQE9_9BILA